MTQSKPYQPSGYLAVDPSALLQMFVPMPTPPDVVINNGIAVVTVDGPLNSKSGRGEDSYPEIQARTLAAFDDPAVHSVLLKVSSPGGSAAGAYDPPRKVRAKALQTGKPLYSHIGGSGAGSSGYAVASCATHGVWMDETATCGSIGILKPRYDLSKANAMQGIEVTFFASGARKADGSPALALTAQEAGAEQVVIDSMARGFFNLVADFRGISASEVRALEAGVFHGEFAVAAKLVDRIGSFDELLSMISETQGSQMAQATIESVKASLEALTHSDDQEIATAAQRALSALDAPTDEPSSEDQTPKEKVDEPPAEKKAEEPAKKDEDDEPKASALAAMASGYAAMRAELDGLRAERANAAKSAYFASRPDLDAKLIKVLTNKPLDEIKKIVDALPVIPRGAQAFSGVQHSEPVPPKGVTVDDQTRALIRAATGTAGLSRRAEKVG